MSRILPNTGFQFFFGGDLLPAKNKVGHLQVGVALQPGAQVTQLPATFKPRIFFTIHWGGQKPRLLELGDTQETEKEGQIADGRGGWE